MDRLVIFGGDFPISVGDMMVSTISVSSSHYGQDSEVAQAGLGAVGAV